MAKYFIKDVIGLPDPAYDIAALSGIPPWRREYILKYLRPIDRRLSLGAWRLMEETLEKYGFSAADVMIGEKGKPLCKGIFFNISHSGSMAMCAVSRHSEVGCDIEKAENPPFEIMERVFSQKEQKYIYGGQNEEDRTRRFFRLWTIKESYMKMTGEGLGISPLTVEADADTLTLTRDKIPVECSLFSTSYGSYEISICEQNKSSGI